MSNTTRPSTRGRRNTRAGAFFEKQLRDTFTTLETWGICAMSKAPTPLKIISRAEEGVFRARIIVSGQPDFYGVLRGGRAVVIEAKHTGTAQMPTSRLLEHQAEALRRHAELGALTLVAVSFGSLRIGLIPWSEWCNLKAILGRKYVTFEDLEPHGWAVENMPAKLGLRLQQLAELPAEDMRPLCVPPLAQQTMQAAKFPR